MLSYQHEYHAGNAADVFKHACLCFLLESLCKKEKPFTLIDTHASCARFSYDDERIKKTGEAAEGIEKVLSFFDRISDSEKNSLPESLNSYIIKEARYRKQNIYAGSAELERLHLRKGDVLHLTEKHPAAFSSLEKNAREELLCENGSIPSPGKTVLHNDDAWKTLLSLTPPLVKRGMIFCDPSFEDKGDYTDAAGFLSRAHKKWNTAVIVLWYPLLSHRKDEKASMLSRLEYAAKTGNPPCECFYTELTTKNESDIQEGESRLYGSGLFVMNPPWKSQETFESIKASLEKILA